MEPSATPGPPAAPPPDLPPGRPPAARPTRLTAWQGGLAAFLGIVTSQLTGGLVAALTIGVLLVMSGGGVEQAEALETTLPVLAMGTLALQATLVAFAFITPLIARVGTRDALGLRGAPALTFVAACLGALGLGPVADALMVAFSSLAPDLTLGTLADMMDVFRRSPAWLLWPLIALVPGLCEELFFRGLLQRSLGNGPLAIGVAAVAFALVHLDPPHVLGVLPLGLFFGWVAARTGSVLVPIVAHVSNNTVSLIAVHVSVLDVGFGTDRPMPHWWAGAGAALAATCVLVIFWATRRRPV